MGGFYVAGWAETSCVRRDAVVWRYACSTSAWYSLFLHGLLVTLTVPPGVCLWGRGSGCSVGYENHCVSKHIVKVRCERSLGHHPHVSTEPLHAI